MIARDTDSREHRFARQSDTRHFIFLRQFDHDIRERRVDMKIQMPINVIQISDQLQMQFDLRAAFRLQLLADARSEKISESVEHWIISELAERIHYGRDLRG